MPHLLNPATIREWLPTRRVTRRAFIAISVATAVWLGMFALVTMSLPTGHLVPALLLGGVYGCFYGAVTLTLEALLLIAGAPLKNALRPPHAFRVSMTLWILHLVCAGTLSSLGWWHWPFPWALGVLGMAGK